MSIIVQSAGRERNIQDEEQESSKFQAYTTKQTQVWVPMCMVNLYYENTRYSKVNKC